MQPTEHKSPSRPTAAVQQLEQQYAPMWAVRARPWLVAASTIAPQAALLLGQLLLPPPAALLPLSVAYAHSGASGSYFYWGYGLLALMMPVVRAERHAVDAGLTNTASFAAAALVYPAWVSLATAGIRVIEEVCLS